jgi:hypothetical protein
MTSNDITLLSTAAALQNIIEGTATLQLHPGQIDNAVHALQVVGGNTTRRDYPARLKTADEAKTRQELKQVSVAADALYAALDAMHAPAAALIGSLEQQMTSSRILGLVARTLAEGPIELPAMLEHLSPKEMLAYDAACVFIEITGKRPTIVTRQSEINGSLSGSKAAGDFITFLERVFHARGIGGGVEASARAAIKAMDFNPVK